MTIKEIKMNLFELTKDANPDREIKSLKDVSFNKYGRVLNVDVDESIIRHMKSTTEIPKEKNIYVASDRKMESNSFHKYVEATVYGEMEAQIGYCNGNNDKINGYEFHHCPEVLIAITPLILSLTICNTNEIKIENADNFFIEEGTVIELFPMVGHFSPIKVKDSGFKAVIILTKGTNLELETNISQEIFKENQIKPFAKNKWLFVHEDRMDLVEKGAYKKVVGNNTAFKTVK